METTNEEGFLVAKNWLETMEKRTAPTSKAPESARRSSLFYDVRPAQIKNDWINVSAGVWSAKANFIVNNVVDESFVFDAVTTIPSQEPTQKIGDRVYVVWRGRWEMLEATRLELFETPNWDLSDGVFRATGYRVESNGETNINNSRAIYAPGATEQEVRSVRRVYAVWRNNRWEATAFFVAPTIVKIYGNSHEEYGDIILDDVFFKWESLGADSVGGSARKKISLREIPNPYITGGTGIDVADGVVTNTAPYEGVFARILNPGPTTLKTVKEIQTDGTNGAKPIFDVENTNSGRQCLQFRSFNPLRVVTNAGLGPNGELVVEYGTVYTM